jgi:hypothetical protein
MSSSVNTLLKSGQDSLGIIFDYLKPDAGTLESKGGSYNSITDLRQFFNMSLVCK